MDAAVSSLAAGALGPSAACPGFRRAGLRLVAELERLGVEPPAFEDALARWSGRGPRRPYARDLAALYAAYRERLAAAGLVDRELWARRALDSLRAAPMRWGGEPVFLYGFDDFTELELDAVETLALRAGARVTVSLPFEAGREAFRAVAGVAGRLAEMADEHECLAASADHYAPQARAALHHVERSLLEAGEPRASADGAVELLRAGGERAELELVGARVLSLLRAGTPPGAVAVVLRDPAAYASLLEQVFTAYGIPWAGERHAPLRHTALGHGLLGLLRAAGPDGSADDVLAYLRTPGLLRVPDLADGLEAELRRSGAAGAADAAALWADRHWPLDQLDALEGAQGSAERLERIRTAVDALFAGPRRRSAPILAPEELADAQVWRATREALDGLAALLAGDAVPALDLARIHDALADVPVSLGGRPQLDRVQVTSPEGVRARRFSAVFVCGLQEGEFPRMPGSEPFLADEDRREIAAATGLALRLREDELDRERYLFYVCASRAERLLALSSRVSDEEGNPAMPSFFLDDVRALFAEEPVGGTRSLAQVTWPADEAPTPVEWERARAAADRSPADPFVPGPRELVHPAVLAWLRERPSFSAGALEDFTECPVKWLVEQVLRPDDLEPDPEQLVRGSYAHRVLELTYARLRDATGSARVTPASLGRAERLLLAAVEECGPAYRISPRASRARAAVRRLQSDLVRHLRREAELDTPFEPVELEFEFGGPARDGAPSRPPLEMAGVRLRGRIDRVDRWGSHAIVRDYKTGRKAYPGARWREDGRLQAAVYMLAVRQLMGLDPVAGVYVPLSGPDPKPRGIWLDELEPQLGEGLSSRDRRSREELEDQLEAARETVCEVVRRVREGRVRCTPADCHWRGEGCTYPGICRLEG
jgi:ATP-dependent helicase/DNAse subunit B